MATSKADYVKRLETLLRAVKRVPANQFSLETVGIYTETTCGEYVKVLGTKAAIQGGAVGCLLGWSNTIRPVGQWVKRNKRRYNYSRWTTCAAYYAQPHTFFSRQLDDDCGINRIRTAIARLKP